MSAVIAPQVAAEILAKVDASDGSDRALDRIAGEHGLMLRELRALMARRRTPIRKVTAPRDEEPDVPAGSKPCTRCTQVKPLAEFYPDPSGKHGRKSICRTCQNQRQPTQARMMRNRGRKRANAILAQRHRAEFQQLLEQETEKAWAEHERLVAEAEARGQHDAAVARLKPGPKRQEETDVAQRLDVARCPKCHTHHDEQHVCPSCGEETPQTPLDVKPYVVRAWAIDTGLDVPTRGPIPDRILAAYQDAHPEAAAS